MRIPLRPAPLLAVLLVGLVAYGYAWFRGTPEPALAMVGLGDAPLQVRGGVVLEVTPPPGLSPAERAALPGTLGERVRGLGFRPDIRDRGERIDVVLVGYPADVADRAVDALTTPRRLALRPVLHGTPFARELYQRATAGAFGPDIKGEVDSWRGEDASETVSDFFLTAPDEAAMTRLLGAIETPPEMDVLVESAEALDDKTAPYVRTFVVGRDVIVSDADVTEAVVSYDPNTNRPLVLVDFSDDGARRFGEWTSAHAGQKLAILVDDVVTSAPVVNGPILGGRASITMGTATTVEAQAEAESLVAALRARAPVPAGVTARVTTTADPAHGRLRAARILFAALCALLALAIAIPLSRRTASWPSSHGLPHQPGARGEALLRLAVTVAVVAGLLALARVRMPGLYDEAEGAGFSIATLGITPMVSAAVLIELLALLIPAWRRRRHAGYEARRPLRAAAAISAVALALVQAHYAVAHIQLMEQMAPGTGPALLATLSIAAAVSLHVLGALWISRHGIGHGLAVLVGVAIAAPLLELRDAPPVPLLFLAGVAGLTAILTAMVVRTRVRIDGEPGSLRLPLSGDRGVGAMASVIALLTALAAFGVPGTGPAIDALTSLDIPS